jgi:hypothetical protein
MESSKNVLITLLIGVLIFVAGCGTSTVQAPSQKTEATPAPVNNKIGNAFLNISQGQGLATQQGGTIFYVCPLKGGTGTTIYKTDQDNSQNSKL